jgi:hypothetical protein
MGIEIRPMANKPSEFKPIRINCGGDGYTDSSGAKWEHDIYYNGGSRQYSAASNTAIRATTDNELYQTERFDRKNLKYEIQNVPQGTYKVLLHFSENWFTSKNEFAGGKTTGARVFDIAIEKSVVVEQFDIYKEAGEFTAVTKELTAYVEDGTLTIECRAIQSFPKINGFEIFPLTEVYRWDNYEAEGLNLIVMNALDSSWSRIFDDTVAAWDNGEPDSLKLFPVKSSHNPECEAVPNQIVVCNGDYGDVPWTGLNTITLQGGYIRSSVARMNNYYLTNGSEELKRYALCHELGKR